MEGGAKIKPAVDRKARARKETKQARKKKANETNKKAKAKANANAKAKAKANANAKAKAKAKANANAKAKAARARAQRITRAKRKPLARRNTRAKRKAPVSYKAKYVRITRAKRKRAPTRNARRTINRELYQHMLGVMGQQQQQHMRQMPPIQQMQKVPLKCTNLVDCMVFQIENQKVMSFFNYFIDFQYFVKCVGFNNADAGNVNGDIHKLTFSRNNVEIHTLLKKAKTKQADNLYYEYSAGTYVNTLSTRFPCFVYTYGLYFASTKHDGKELSNILHINATDKKIYELACLGPLRLRVMVQYIQSVTFSKYLVAAKQTDPNFACTLTQILFQIYGPLSIVINTYTHYDLHSSNILLYTLPNNQYIDMVYRYNGHDIKFRTTVIVKIIDYGRSFFPQAAFIGQKLCETPQCTTSPSSPCGASLGFLYVYKNKSSNMSYIESYKRNMSHDLRLIEEILFYTNENAPEHRDLRAVCKTVKYKGTYGTPEDTRSGDAQVSYNVPGFLRNLTKHIQSRNFVDRNNAMHQHLVKKGTMISHMNSTANVEFISI